MHPMSQNTRFVLKAVCDAARPYGDLDVSPYTVESALPYWHAEMDKTEDIIINLYSDVIDGVTNQVNMKLKPAQLVARVETVLRKQRSAEAHRAAEKLVWYGIVCRCITHLYSQRSAPIEYVPFDL